MWKKIIISSLFLLCSFFAWSQDTLSGNFIKLHLLRKNYVINDVVSVTDSLIVDAGANIQLANNVTMVCLGAVFMNGTATNRIKVLSRKNQTGTGFVIAAQSNDGLQFKYVNFDSLVMPISFTDGWFRPDTRIQNCQFVHNVGTTAIIQVLNPTVPMSDNIPIASFRLNQSLFAGNIAPIRFEDLQSDFLRIDVSNNSFVGNKISGYAQYTFSGNMIFGRMDRMQSRFKAVIKENSFVNNFLRDIDADTLIQQAHMGIYGNADSLVVPNNYWGDNDEKEIRKHLFDYSLNYNSPKLVITPFEFGPKDTLPPHVYDLENTKGRAVGGPPKRRLIGDKWVLVQDTVSNITYNYNLRQGLRGFRMVTNRPVLTRTLSVHYMYLKDSLTMADSVLLLGAYRKDETTKNKVGLNFTLLTDSLFRTKPGYLLIKGMEGQQGETVPEVVIGYESFLKYLYSRKSQYALARFLKASDSTTQKPKGPPVIVSAYKKKYELGLVAGNAIYYGTLSNAKLFANDFNSIFGLQFRYSLKKNVSLSISYLSCTLTGSDKRSGDSSKVARGFSFQTPTTTISIQFEYDFFDNRIYSSVNKIRPSIGFGVDMINFNPMGEYLGKLYPLQPLGTGGQTIPATSAPTATNPAPAPYALSTLGAPVTAQVRYYLNKKTIFSLFATYHLSFTNYLDDVGPDPYPDPVALAKANPTNPDAAVYFANPTNRFVRKGQLRSGAADVSDGYFTFGFTLAHHF